MKPKEDIEQVSNRRLSKSIVTERISVDKWLPPWVRYQHLARYEWVKAFTRGCVVIEAACGSGYGGKMILDGGATRVDCFDLAEEAIETARSKFGGERLSFQVADVMNLPVPTATYDVFVSFETIEHVANDRDFLREVCRVLKPNGRFICSTPNRAMTNAGTSMDHQSFNPYHRHEYLFPEFAAVLKSFFGSVELYAQRPFDFRYAAALAAVGKRVPWLAARLHQARKLLCMPWERQDKHYPQALPVAGESEVLIGVCAIVQ